MTELSNSQLRLIRVIHDFEAAEGGPVAEDRLAGLTGVDRKQFDADIRFLKARGYVGRVGAPITVSDSPIRRPDEPGLIVIRRGMDSLSGSG
jgi:hypothetical protein